MATDVFSETHTSKKLQEIWGFMLTKRGIKGAEHMHEKLKFKKKKEKKWQFRHQAH